MKTEREEETATEREETMLGYKHPALCGQDNEGPSIFHSLQGEDISHQEGSVKKCASFQALPFSLRACSIPMRQCCYKSGLWGDA